MLISFSLFCVIAVWLRELRLFYPSAALSTLVNPVVIFYFSTSCYLSSDTLSYFVSRKVPFLLLYVVPGFFDMMLLALAFKSVAILDYISTDISPLITGKASWLRLSLGLLLPPTVLLALLSFHVYLSRLGLVSYSICCYYSVTFRSSFKSFSAFLVGVKF